MTWHLALSILIFLATFVLRALFAGTEIAFVTTNRLAVKTMVQEGHQRAIALDKQLDNMQRVITIALIGTNLFGVISTVMSTYITLEMGLFGGNVSTATTIMIFAVLFFGEIIPKNIFSKHAMEISMFLCPIIDFMAALFRPLIALFNFISRLLLGKGAGNGRSLQLTGETIKTMVTMSEEEGAIEEQEMEMIHNVLESNQLYLRDILQPRVNMVAVDIEDGAEEALDRIIESGYSRIPVYEDTIDNVIGILHAKDLMDYFVEQDSIAGLDLRSLLRDPYFVPESKLVGDSLPAMRERGVQIAIVLDEYGGVEGMVSLEDILEEIVGEIQDEHDEDELPEVEFNEDETLSIDPRISLTKLEELLDLDLSDEESDTLAGLIYEELGRVPLVNEEVDILPDYSAKVLEVEGNKIIRVELKEIVEEELVEDYDKEEPEL